MVMYVLETRETNPLAELPAAQGTKRGDRGVRLLRPQAAPSDLPEDPHTIFFAHSAAMRAVRQRITQAAATDATVVIEGESGVGKSLVAHALHAASTRRGRPLVKVNCATLPGELMESELFGHERGAFTGADRRKPGKFEIAHEGTILLDEIGELPLTLQAKLLQVLQDGTFAALGGTRDLQVNVRVLAATNRSLAQAVDAGGFRADLYYRLNVIRIEVPPLRARRDEIPILAQHFMRLYAIRYDRPCRLLGPETLACFLAYDWPGNIRELENMVRRIIVLEDEPEVRAELRAREAVASAPAAPDPVRLDLKAAVRRRVREVERALIAEALHRTSGNRADAAGLLGISTKALGYKLYGLRDGYQ